MEKSDCHNCGRPVSGNVCPLPPGQVNECLRTEERVSWVDVKTKSLSEKEIRIRSLVDAHWRYVSQVLTTGQDKSQTFSFDQVMAIREHDYRSAMIHGYGHGVEDAEKVRGGKEK